MMNEMPKDDCGELPLRAFDSRDEYAVLERRLPHWCQRGTISFITWSTWDSMPAHVVAGWLGERETWLRQHDIGPTLADWETRLRELPNNVQREFKMYISNRWNDHLDVLHGACVLRRTELAHVVADSLCLFDGERYVLTDYVVMPNHVHLLAAFPDEDGMLRQCRSWKHYTAGKINRVLGRKGRFWQRDSFDHLVRSAEYFEHYRAYIADNPIRARLRPDEFIHERKDLSRMDAECTRHTPRDGQ